MCDHWNEPKNTRLLTSALLVSGLVGFEKFTKGNPIPLWEIHPGVYAWTFSYHDNAKADETLIHWQSSLVYYYSKKEAEEAMANFVTGLNVGWRAS